MRASCFGCRRRLRQRYRHEDTEHQGQAARRRDGGLSRDPGPYAGRRHHRDHGDLGRQRHHAGACARVRRGRIRLSGARPVLAAGARGRAFRSQSRACEEGVRSLLRLRLRPSRARHGGHLALSGETAGVQRQGRGGRLLSRRQALLPHVLPHRHRLRRRLLRHLYRAPHPRGQEPPPAVRAAHGAEGSLGASRGERTAGAAAVTQSAEDGCHRWPWKAKGACKCPKTGVHQLSSRPWKDTEGHRESSHDLPSNGEVPAMKLTVGGISGLDLPKGKSDHIVWDDDVPGFGVRLREGGSRTWILQYKIGDKHRRMNLGAVKAVTLGVARKTAGNLYHRVKLGEDPAGDKAETKIKAAETFEAIAGRFLEHQRSRLRPSSYEDVERHILTYAKPLHRLGLAKIQRRDIATVLTTVAKNNGATTSNRARSSLSTLFSWAMMTGLVEANPV